MLCKHLPVEAACVENGPVFLFNTDPSVVFAGLAPQLKREAETPARVEVPFEGLEKGLEIERMGRILRAACADQRPCASPAIRTSLTTTSFVL